MSFVINIKRNLLLLSFYILIDREGYRLFISDENINGWEFIAKSDLMVRPTSTDVNAISTLTI